MSRNLTLQESKQIDDAVAHFDEHRHLFEGFAKNVVDSLRVDSELGPFIHFIKYRLKSPERLRTKLIKKAMECKRGRRFAITSKNLFEKINDLAGIRILHLHTNQIHDINLHIKRILKQIKIRIIEGPVVHCWDRDYENLFKKFGIAIKLAKDTKAQESLYTSVHYVLAANERTKISFELQVRTLADEIWGEVSHKVAYEEAEPDTHVKDQLKVLARLTSAAARLVDSIFDTFSDTETSAKGPSIVAGKRKGEKGEIKKK